MKKLTFIFLLILLPMMANAYDAQIDGFYYNLITKAKQAEVTKGDTKYIGSVNIPSSITYEGVTYSVTSIGLGAFAGCSSLASVTCEAKSVPSTGDYAFADVPLNSATLYVPASALEDYKATSPWSDFGTIVAIPDGGMRGDVNGDGIVNGTDIQAIINAIVEGEYDKKADVNEDETVNGTDIQEVINIIVEGE